MYAFWLAVAEKEKLYVSVSVVDPYFRLEWITVCVFYRENLCFEMVVFARKHLKPR